jgi:hypothetical protein
LGACARIVLNSGMLSLAYDLEDLARLEYSRLLWRNSRTRRRLLHVWEHPKHPHRERFHENRPLVVGLLECEDPQRYVETLPGGVWSLRTLTREIPCMIWELWDESAARPEGPVLTQK